MTTAGAINCAMEGIQGSNMAFKAHIPLGQPTWYGG